MTDVQTGLSEEALTEIIDTLDKGYKPGMWAESNMRELVAEVRRLREALELIARDGMGSRAARNAARAALAHPDTAEGGEAGGR